jgi:hypothetical protein
MLAISSASSQRKGLKENDEARDRKQWKCDRPEKHANKSQTFAHERRGARDHDLKAGNYALDGLLRSSCYCTVLASRRNFAVMLSAALF